MITGTNLAATTRSWTEADFQGNRLPLSLDDVVVTVDGKPAAISYVSPTQINAQCPDITSNTRSVVQLKGPTGVSNTYIADARQISPTLWTLPPPNDRYVAAFHGDGAPVGNPDLYGGAIMMRPAAPGEIILMFGTGFGPSNPALPAGLLPSGNPQLAGSLQVTIGGMQARVVFDGITYPGQVQFNVTVPPGFATGSAARDDDQ